MRVVDQAGRETTGCTHHAAVLLASLVSGRVYPGPDDPGGAAIEAHRLATTLPPFAFLTPQETR